MYSVCREIWKESSLAFSAAAAFAALPDDLDLLFPIAAGPRASKSASCCSIWVSSWVTMSLSQSAHLILATRAGSVSSLSKPARLKRVVLWSLSTRLNVSCKDLRRKEAQKFSYLKEERRENREKERG